jgi:hypothetical protein
MKYEDYKKLELKKEDLIKIKVPRYRRITGYFKEETLVIGISLYSGCEAIKLYPKRNGFVKYYKIIPICKIEELNILKRSNE